MNRERKHDAVRLRRVLMCAGPLLLAMSPGVWAQAQQEEGQQASWGLDLGARYTDNVGRVDTNEESDTVGIAGVNFAVDVNRPRFGARAAADVRYQKYFDSTFDNDIQGGLDGTMSFAFVPQRLVWVVQDNYGQVSRNREVADNPANLSDINYFSTGPDLTLPFGARTSVQLSGRWSDAYFEDAEQDSETLSGSAALGLSVEAVDADTRKQLGLPSGQGVVISDVTGPVAGEADLQPGDVVLMVNQQRIANVAEFQAATKDVKAGSTVLLLIRRGDQSRFVGLTVPAAR